MQIFFLFSGGFFSCSFRLELDIPSHPAKNTFVARVVVLLPVFFTGSGVQWLQAGRLQHTDLKQALCDSPTLSRE